MRTRSWLCLGAAVSGVALVWWAVSSVDARFLARVSIVLLAVLVLSLSLWAADSSIGRREDDGS